MFERQDKGGKTLPGIPGSYGHEDPQAARKASARNLERARRGESPVAPTAMGEPTVRGGDGPSFTGGVPVERVEQAKAVARLARLVVRAAQGFVILLVLLAAVGVLADDDDDDPRRPGAGRFIPATDEAAFTRAANFRAALDDAAGEVPDGATLISGQCYSSNCSFTFEHGDDTTNVQLDARRARGRAWGVPTEPGVALADVPVDGADTLVAGVEQRFGLGRDDLMRVVWSVDDRWREHDGWKAVYYPDSGERREFVSDDDGRPVRELVVEQR